MVDYSGRMMTRKQFLRVGSAGAAALAIRPFAWAEPDASKFYFALIADTHIIDSFYKGPEGNAEDTESIFKTSERLIAARTLINSLQPKMERVFLIGDYFHNYPSREIDFYFQNETRLDRAKASDRCVPDAGARRLRQSRLRPARAPRGFA